MLPLFLLFRTSLKSSKRGHVPLYSMQSSQYIVKYLAPPYILKIQLAELPKIFVEVLPKIYVGGLPKI